MEKLFLIYKIIEKVNAKDIIIYKTKNNTPYFDYAIIATVSSQRQLSAVSSNIKKEAVENNFDVRGVEGANGGEWVLIDANDVLINVFTKEAREHYALDRVWKNLPTIEF